jgi:hypothetical protein
MASMKNNRIFLPENTVPEFHFFQRFHFDWEMVFYCHNEDHLFVSSAESAFNYRESKARDFMNRLQRRLRLRQGEMIYFVSTEFGKSGYGHLHLFVSFDPLRKKQKHEKITNCGLKIQSQVAAIKREMFPESLKVGIQKLPAGEQGQKRKLSYICKRETGRDYKHCFFSKWILKAA